ncbi:DUF2254 domain-containing protein [Streptomyces sp. JJ66]|uniref:DUF2254 domain-containing protein n=1 Tax=Streptomyces sp. JJ66 TaxID=2803843 RepID=UPI001C58114E|nr:DUF2254 domain-containing protein [Streptomyces sp. JJ66]MBW1601443.1 DUF2254 domain-containing protein [Streptomyces sp. JJ66]
MSDTLRAQLWPLPTLGVGLAVVAGVGMPRVDKRIQYDMPAGLDDYLFGGNADAARSVLGAIAGSMITVTALTFSLTVLTLQLASSQFSPRLLRTFAADRYVQTTLALFLATFTYALTVLRTVRTGEDGRTGFVPQVSVTVAFMLTLTSVLALVLFLSHLAREIRIETMMSSVHTAAQRTIRRVFPAEPQEPDAPEGGGEPHGSHAAGDPRGLPPEPPANALLLTVGASGFLTAVDEGTLLRAAVESDAVVFINRSPGSSLITGTPVGAAWPRDGGSFAPDIPARLTADVAGALTTGPERTDRQDVALGLRQFADVAAKALSPGVNDPTTAVHALSHASALLCELARHDLGPRLLCDDDQQIRAVLRRPDLEDLLDLAVAQPMRYGAAEPAVLSRIAMLLRELAWSVAPGRQTPVAAALTRLRATIDAQDFHPAERLQLTELTELVDQALAGQWPLGPTP